MPNEAMDRQQAEMPALPEAPALPGPQPRPALTLVNSHREMSYENYECFIGVSPNVSDLKKFIGVHASQTHPILLIGERGLRQEQIARALHQAGAQWAQPFFAVNAHGLGAEALHNILFGPRNGRDRQTGNHLHQRIDQSVAAPAATFRCLHGGATVAHARQPPEAGLRFGVEPRRPKAENRIAYGLVEMLRHLSFTIKPLRERSEDIPYIAKYLISRIARSWAKERTRSPPRPWPRWRDTVGRQPRRA